MTQQSEAISDPACTTARDLPCPDCTLDRLGIGQCGTVMGIGGEDALRRRLMEMGFCRGTRVEVVRRSPFGDPVELRLRGYCLSLRDEQARCISVAPAVAAAVLAK